MDWLLTTKRWTPVCAGIVGMFIFSSCQRTPDPEKVRVNVLTTEFIYEQAPFPQCHASTIVETGDKLLASWFGGTHEKHPDVCIYVSAKQDGKWGVPRMVADGIISDTLRYPCWNPVLFKRDNGDIILYYKVGPDPREWRGMYKVSADDGNSWSEAVPIPDGLLGPIKNKPKRLADGTVLYPTSFETSEMWRIYVETSDQELENWKKVGIDNNGYNAIQPTILFYPDGRVQMLCRSKEKKIVETWSDDHGKTWTPVQATSLINNNSGIDGVTLDNGLQLLVCNPLERGRNKLSLMASTNGKEWTEILVLEDQTEGEFSYPAIIEGKDNTIHITYTWNRDKVKYVHLELVTGKNRSKSSTEEARIEDFSSEIVKFVPYQGNPVFAGTGTNTWDRKIRERGYILYEDGLYKMWYSGYKPEIAEQKFLGYATSKDGINWTRFLINLPSAVNGQKTYL